MKLLALVARIRHRVLRVDKVVELLKVGPALVFDAVVLGRPPLGRVVLDRLQRQAHKRRSAQLGATPQNTHRRGTHRVPVDAVRVANIAVRIGVDHVEPDPKRRARLGNLLEDGPVGGGS